MFRDGPERVDRGCFHHAEWHVCARPSEFIMQPLPLPIGFGVDKCRGNIGRQGGGWHGFSLLNSVRSRIPDVRRTAIDRGD